MTPRLPLFTEPCYTTEEYLLSSKGYHISIRSQSSRIRSLYANVGRDSLGSHSCTPLHSKTASSCRALLEPQTTTKVHDRSSGFGSGSPGSFATTGLSNAAHSYSRKKFLRIASMLFGHRSTFRPSGSFEIVIAGFPSLQKSHCPLGLQQ